MYETSRFRTPTPAVDPNWGKSIYQQAEERRGNAPGGPPSTAGMADFGSDELHALASSAKHASHDLVQGLARAGVPAEQLADLHRAATIIAGVARELERGGPSRRPSIGDAVDDFFDNNDDGLGGALDGR